MCRSMSAMEMSETETSPVAEMWRETLGDKVRVEVRTAHLVHVELALPSSELSVAGCEVPDEVVAGSMKENISKYIYWKENQVQENEKYGLWWQKPRQRIYERDPRYHTRKNTFFFSLLLGFLFWFDAEFAVNAVCPGNALTCHLCPSRTPPPWLFCGGKNESVFFQTACFSYITRLPHDGE